MSDLAKANAAIRVAVERRDRAGLRQAAAIYLAADPMSSGRAYTSSLGYQQLGAALLAGQGPTLAASLRARLRYELPTGDGEVPFDSVPENQLKAGALRPLFHIRLLSGRDEPVMRPGMRIPPSTRAGLRRGDQLLAAFAAYDARKAKAAITGFIHDDQHEFSLLGYALYEEAAKRGMVLQKPKKYDF